MSPAGCSTNIVKKKKQIINTRQLSTNITNYQQTQHQMANRDKPLNSATSCCSSPMDGAELRELCRLRAPPDRQRLMMIFDFSDVQLCAIQGV